MPDQLSTLYGEFLEGDYDCVDRVVCNAYFSMGQSGGGFRMWWRELYGSDENLNNNQLMRMAGRFSRRLRAWARANDIPVVYCAPGERKHEIAEEHLATTKAKPGLFLILVSKAPALVWEAQQTGAGKLGQLAPKKPWPYVNHYSFHILDSDWGHVTIKMSGHPPLRRAGDSQRARICGGAGEKSWGRVHQTGELLHRSEASINSEFARTTIAPAPITSRAPYRGMPVPIITGIMTPPLLWRE